MHRRKASALRVFVSRPTTVEAPFEREYAAFERHLVASGLESQRLGRANYSKKAPLLAVREILAECAGAIVLGYPHTRHVHRVVRGVTTTSEFGLDSPTPWNQIEGALAYGQGLPLLVVAHSSISGGIFDHGVTGEMVLTIDLAARGWFKTAAFRQPFEEFLVELRARATARSH